LISSYAERDKMLFRSLADIYKNLQTFTVVELDGNVVGCCALQVIWPAATSCPPPRLASGDAGAGVVRRRGKSDLAEIKSLAVDEENTGTGVGKMLVAAATEQACQLGLPRIFALTLNPDFFEKLGFKIIEKDSLPMKVWSDCAKCPKQQNCDEIAVIKTVLRDV